MLHGATRAFARAARIYSLSCFADDEHLEYDDADVTLTLNKFIVALRSLRLVAHGTLTSLNVQGLAMCCSPAFTSLARAIVAARLTSLRLSECFMNTNSGAGLVNLMTHSYLERLEIFCSDIFEEAIFDAATGPAFGAAMMSNTRLRLLVLENVCLWKVPADGVAVLAGATGHPTLRELSVAHNECHHLNLEASTPGERVAAAAVMRESLHALVAANSPALLDLKCNDSCLTFACLAPLMDALPSNTHLKALDVSSNMHDADDSVDDARAFARAILSAARRNTALVSLSCAQGVGRVEPPEIVEAERCASPEWLPLRFERATRVAAEAEVARLRARLDGVTAAQRGGAT